MSTPKQTPDTPELATANDTVIAEIVETGSVLSNPVPSDTVVTETVDAEASDHRPADLLAAARPAAGPRTRWAAIVWGLVFAALAGGALYIVLSPEHRLELIEWVTSLEATTLALYGALAIGVIVLLFGLVGLLRRTQRALAARRSSAR